MAGTYLLDHAKLDWQGTAPNSAPYSTTYEDIYWHRDGALAEKQHVFVEPLKQLTQSLHRYSQVSVGELGFGFGINCMLTADFWSEMPADCHLNFISIEKHPVSQSDLAKQLHQYNFKFTEALLAQYPDPIQGQHIIWLAPNIRLLLILDDAESALANLDAQVDFWFLDGFAPAKNESMWQPSIYKKMFARSRSGARVATYSAAGHVRRGLEHSGFITNKITGFSHKKEMLSAQRPGTWLAQPHGAKSTLIIGAGMAGLYCAEAFQRRGIKYQLVDSGEAGPSTIPQLTVLPQLAVRPEARYRFSLAALQYMQSSSGFHRSTVLWQARTQEEKERLHRIAAQFPDSLIEQMDDGEVLFHKAGWLSYAQLLAGINPDITRNRITGIAYKNNYWNAECETGPGYTADQIILATGFNRSLLAPELQIRAVRGQAVSVPTENVARVINSHATVFPTLDGRSLISGTYARRDDLKIEPEETRQLIRSAEKLIRSAEKLTEISSHDAIPYVGIRAVSRDRLPVIGEVPHWQDLDGINRVTAVKSFQTGLFLCTAFGSRGATHARLCAEHVVAKSLGEPGALDLKHQAMLSPARFVIRDAV